MTTASNRPVLDAIEQQCGRVLSSRAFTAWRAGAKLRAGDVVAFNNSFLYREGRGTAKSDLYLGVSATSDSDLSPTPVVLTSPGRINLQFKRLAARELDKYKIETLYDAVSDQTARLGPIVLSLVARVGEPAPASVDVSDVPGVSTLAFDPHQGAAATYSDQILRLNAVSVADEAWAAIKEEAGDTLDLDALAENFEAAFGALREAAARPIDLSDVPASGPSVLTRVIERMRDQVTDFDDALAHHVREPGDRETFNELLRLAYNFADGVRAFMSLLVGICDLKPLIFWLTVCEQIELADRFADLPFSLVGKTKPSLERYRAVIADARNQAFHDVFAFDHPFTVSLPGDALRAPRLLLFRDYNRRSEPALTFQDRELVDLFQALTRTSERPVPEGFWEGNQRVMAGVVDLVAGLHSALVVTAGTSPSR